MDISYAKDYRHNYLVISDDRVLENDYQLHMVVKNDVLGLLKCQERMINGKGLLYYEVTSKQSLKNLYDHQAMGFDDICNIFENIKRTCDNLSRYLLSGSELILEPEYVYMDIDSKECYFLYYPFYENEKENNIASLLAYLLERHNTEDIKAVEAVYQLTDMIERQHLKLSEALEWFSREFSEVNDEKPIPEDISPTYSYTEDNIDEDIVPQRRFGFITKLIECFTGRRKDDDEFVFEAPNYDFQSIGQAVEKPPKDNEATVFIPWVENSEQKLYGVGRGNKYHIDLKKTPLIVGKQEGAVDMIIQDSSVSRMHAKITKSGTKFFISDLNSTNGTFRNGLRLLPNETVSIEPGDEIGLGKLKFIYR